MFTWSVLVLVLSFFPDIAGNNSEQIPNLLSQLQFALPKPALVLFCLSLFLAWMGYTLRTLVCVLESQLPDST